MSYPNVRNSLQRSHDDLELTQVDGGADYFKRFSRFPYRSDPWFFTIGIWYSYVTSASDVATDQAAGINTYISLTSSSTLSYLNGTGMKAFLQKSDWLSNYASWASNTDIVGWVLSDEKDMQYNGAGGDQTQGFADMQTDLNAIKHDGRITYANFGKGVTFYGADKDARRYASAYTDIASVDIYWMTDPDVRQQYQGGKLINGSTAALSATQAQMGYNYGLVVQRQRSLTVPLGSKPVWAFVELGHPSSTDADPTITSSQIVSAVWHSLIAGAQGIIYFNHSFGTNPNYNLIRSVPAVQSTVTALNVRIIELAPILNAPFVKGFCTTSGAVAYCVKYHGGAYYIFAGSKQVSSQNVTFTLAVPGYSVVSVNNESRTIPVSSNSFSDTFSDQDAVHIYKFIL